MAERRRGLGRGIGALIPESQQEAKESPVDVFFGIGAATVEDSVNVSRETAQAGITQSTISSGSEAPKTPHSTTSEEEPEKPVNQKRASIKRVSLKDREATIGQGIVESGLHTPDGTQLRTNPKESALDIALYNPRQGQTDQSRELANSEKLNSHGNNVATADDSTLGTDQSIDSNELVAVPGASYAELPIDSIVPNQRQPRNVFDEDELQELADSIAEVGVLQPVIVRPLDAPIQNAPDARYELIMGERRWRASRLAGQATVPAIVRRTADEDLLRDALLENLHRAQLNPLEEAAAYQQLLEDFHCTQEELSRRIARSRPQISNTLRLMKLPPLVQRRVAAQVISAGHARALLGLSDPAAMERLAQRIVAENLSVRQVEEIVALGDEPAVMPQIKRRAARFAPEFRELSSRLGDRFDTKVAVNMGQRKGTIRIDFGSMEDLNRLIELLAPGEEGIDQPATNGTEQHNDSVSEAPESGF